METEPKQQEAEDRKETYQKYEQLGGIINQMDYERALTQLENTIVVDKMRIKEAEEIANFSEIELHSAKEALDKKVILYGILRDSTAPEEIENHHSQMSDQRIFAETLRMLGEPQDLKKLIQAYPNISFDYHKEGESGQQQDQEHKIAA